MIVIGIIIIVLFAVLIGWTWNNLYNFENYSKTIYVVVCTLIMFLVTIILFNISKSGISYPNESMIKDVRNVLILIFTPINGIIIVPYLAKQLNRIKEKTINKEQLKKKINIILIVFIILIIIECMYLKNIQLGILKIFQNM